MAGGTRLAGMLALAAIVITSAGSTLTGASAAPRQGTRPAAPFQLVRVDPCVTDPAMTCDSAAAGGHVPHIVLVPKRPTAQPRLAIFFPGTGANPAIYAPVGEALAAAGWYVIGLRYPTTITTPAACPAAVYGRSPDCFQQFRSASIFGQNVPDPTGHAFSYAGTRITRVDSVMNRLLKVVAYLAAHPEVAGAGWSQFLAQRNGRCTDVNHTYGACNLDWARIVLGGHSQGAGVALYLARFYTVAQVAMLSGPEDAYLLPGKAVAAPWIASGHFATPISRIYGFTHTGDPYYARQAAAWAALGLPGAIEHFSPTSPVGTSHRIVTSVPSACPQLGTPLADHSATSVIGCVDLPAYRAVWLTIFGVPASDR